MGSTKGVLNRHLKSFGAQDLNGILSDYVPGAVLFTPGGLLRGVDAIKAFFQRCLRSLENLEQASALSTSAWRATMATSYGRQRLLTMCTSWGQTRSWCAMAGLRFSHSRAR